jgi:hypothetical protein
MADQNKSFLSKVREAVDVTLDSYITKSRSSITAEPPTTNDRGDKLAITELDYAGNEQYGWKEKAGLVGNAVLKSMARRDSIVIAIHQTRSAQCSAFTRKQRNRYTPGWIVCPVDNADFDEDQKLELADPNLSEEEYAAKKYEFEQKRIATKKKQQKEIGEIEEFIMHCGMPVSESDTTHKRMDFDKFMKIVVRDRLTYNYAAVELVPQRNEAFLHHFYPVSSGTVRYATRRSAEQLKKLMVENMKMRGIDEADINRKTKKPYRYVQVVRGQVQAAWSEDWFVFEPANPTVDPEDNGYAPGELEMLIQIITAHLYAEAHNRNFFVQGIGSKGLLHIKGENISRAQLEAFKRQWFNQISNTRNAFRPPIIGMADEVKWVPLAQSNREMEFEQWMNYLIRICCAVYQIDPAEINFDISKINTSTLNETSNETRIKSSRDKGLKPLLDYVQNLINNNILPRWNPEYAKNYRFEFVGLDAETRQQEIDRLQKETSVWKTLNEARIEMGNAPIEDGDIVLSAIYSQYLAQKQQADLAAQQQDQQSMMDQGDASDGNQDPEADAKENAEVQELDAEFTSDLENLAAEIGKPETDSKSDKDDTKKSEVAVIEYYIKKDEE